MNELKHALEGEKFIVMWESKLTQLGRMRSAKVFCKRFELMCAKLL